MTEKEKRDKYGVDMLPAKATSAYKKQMQHFQNKGMEAWSWILINGKENTVVYVNTYRGNAGRKWKPKFLDLDVDKLQKKAKQYEVCAVDECPIAELITVV